MFGPLILANFLVPSYHACCVGGSRLVNSVRPPSWKGSSHGMKFRDKPLPTWRFAFSNNHFQTHTLLTECRCTFRCMPACPKSSVPGATAAAADGCGVPIEIAIRLV